MSNTVTDPTIELVDEWEVARRYINLESMRKLMMPFPLVMAEPVPLTLASVH
jgi:hypothetical protein